VPDSNHTPGAAPDPMGQPLAIESARDGDSVTIALSGELDLASVEGLDQAIRDCEESDIGGIIIDLSGLSFIDSTGLSALLGARKRIDGRLHFIPSEHEDVKRVLVMTDTEAILN
jgi:anti-sigma B factor antagonist